MEMAKNSKSSKSYENFTVKGNAKEIKSDQMLERVKRIDTTNLF